MFSCSNVRYDVRILFVYSFLDDDDLEEGSLCLSVASCSASLPSRSSSQPPPNQTHSHLTHSNTRKSQRQGDRDGDGAINNGIAKMKLLEALTIREFPPEQYTHTSNYTGPNYYGTNFN